MTSSLPGLHCFLHLFPRIRIALMSRCYFAAVFLSITTMSHAQSLDSKQKAQELGSILASEEMCGLEYDQDAISRWIDENTDPADIAFASTLSMMIEGSKFYFEEMSTSSKTAHCRSIERTTRHFGFIQ